MPLQLKLRAVKTKKGTTYVYGIYGTTLDGERIRRSLGLGPEHKELAEAAFAKFVHERHSNVVHGKPKDCTFAYAAMLHMKKGGDASRLPPLIKHFGEWMIGDIKETDVMEACETLFTNCKPVTWIRSVYAPLNAVIKRAAKAELTGFKAFENPAYEKVKIRHAPEQWFEDVLPFMNHECAALVVFLTFTGCRVSEACRVVWDDINWERGDVRFAETKGRKHKKPSRRVGLPQLVVSALRIVEKRAAGRKQIFPYAGKDSVNQAIERAVERARKAGKTLDYYSSHKLGRHAFAVRLLKQGHNLMFVQQAGGWMSIKMVTDNYGEIEGSHIDAVMKAVEPGFSFRFDTGLTQQREEKEDKTA